MSVAYLLQAASNGMEAQEGDTNGMSIDALSEVGGYCVNVKSIANIREKA